MNLEHTKEEATDLAKEEVAIQGSVLIEAEGVTRPPPKLPHLNSHTVVLVDADDAMKLNRGGAAEEKESADLTIGRGATKGEQILVKSRLIVQQRWMTKR
ncbi:hypothetical protein S245_034783 [Arachis hypogaea]|nr:uncharacterized protein DS421_10g309310 [Arachis hypogaea]